MKSLRLAAILASFLPLLASANDIDGKWKASFVGPRDNLPRMVREMVFDLKVEGDKLTGTAHMGSWPGDAPISDGKVDGNQITFTAIGKSPWRAGGQGSQSSGYPRLKFIGTVQGNEIKLTGAWDSILIYGKVGTDPTTFQMEAKRLLESQ